MEVSCWKWPCEPAEIISCCYLQLNGTKWQYHRDLSTLSTLPPEWVSKIEKFNETFFEEDILLGYVVIFDGSTVCSVIAIILYNKEDRIVVDFVDVDEWLRFVNSRP